MPRPKSIPIALLALTALSGGVDAAAPLRQPEGVAYPLADHSSVDLPGPEPADVSGGEVRQAQAVEVVPPPPRTVPVPESPLTRPIGRLSLTASPDARLVAQRDKIPERFAIRNLARGRFGSWDAPLYDASRVEPRHPLRGFRFAAPAAYSRPLYFEQENLERYGHSVGWCDRDIVTQSVISTAHFFATAAVLPYKIGAQPPGECHYVLGSYRPGSCNPHQLQHPRKSWRGLLYQGAAVTGMVFLVP